MRDSSVWVVLRFLARCVPLGMLAFSVQAAEVSLVGVFPGKAVLVINGGAPRTIAVGARSPEGVKLVSVDGDTAVVEAEGRKLRLAVGEHAVAAASDSTGVASVTLTADARGHFVTTGSINGAPVRFLVDTGASLIAMSTADAARAGIDYRKGQPGIANTANGQIQIWRVKLNTVQLGELRLHDVEAAVQLAELPVTLLGMSFLNRLEMKRNGETMTLRRRY